jgi:hypothetical protein
VTDGPRQTPSGDSRRDFLRRTLRTSIYVPPAIVAMSMRNVALALQSCPNVNPQGMCNQGGGNNNACGNSGNPNCP